MKNTKRNRKANMNRSVIRILSAFTFSAIAFYVLMGLPYFPPMSTSLSAIFLMLSIGLTFEGLFGVVSWLDSLVGKSKFISRTKVASYGRLLLGGGLLLSWLYLRFQLSPARYASFGALMAGSLLFGKEAIRIMNE